MKKYWQGNQSLVKTFWLLWVAGSLIIAVIGAILVYAFGLIFHLPPASMAFFTFLILVLFNPYYIVCWVAMWRATKNSSSQVVAVSIKFLVVTHIAYVIYSLIVISN